MQIALFDLLAERPAKETNLYPARFVFFFFSYQQIYIFFFFISQIKKKSAAESIIAYGLRLFVQVSDVIVSFKRDVDKAKYEFFNCLGFARGLLFFYFFFFFFCKTSGDVLNYLQIYSIVSKMITHKYRRRWVFITALLLYDQRVQTNIKVGNKSCFLSDVLWLFNLLVHGIGNYCGILQRLLLLIIR